MTLTYSDEKTGPAGSTPAPPQTIALEILTDEELSVLVPAQGVVVAPVLDTVPAAERDAVRRTAFRGLVARGIVDPPEPAAVAAVLESSAATTGDVGIDLRVRNDVLSALTLRQSASAVVAVARMGAREVVVAARRPEQGRELAPLADELGVALHAVPLDGAVAELRDADTVISTLPGDAAAAVPLPRDLPGATVLLDVTYAPWPTGIASAWERAGGRVVPGIDMLVHQALDQVRLFAHGDDARPLPDEERVLAAMLASVDRDPRRPWTGA